jgi:Predicted RNA-binding protein homologous to eukaryotic snRNP
LTEEKSLNPPEPPAFCMALRKRILNGAFGSARLLNGDRLFDIGISARSELKDLETYHLIAELTGGGSNIILTDADFRIIDARKRDYEGKRRAFPGISYEPPAKAKPFIADEAVSNALKSLKGENLYNYILENSSGFSKETAKEAALLSENEDTGSIIKRFLNVYGSAGFKPCVRAADGKIKGYYAFPYHSSAGEYTIFPSLCKAASAYYSSLGERGENKELSAAKTALKRVRERTDKRIRENSSRLEETSKIEEALQTAEILKCNIFNIIKGHSILNCCDFYNTRQIDIPLDPLKTPEMNVEAYYKKYKKLKGAREYALKEREELNALSEYLSAIEASLDTASTANDIAEIKREIASLAGDRGKREKISKKEPQARPLKFDVGGFTVYAGKNNVQNELVTFTLGSAKDIWLHAKGAHGSHVIIKTDGRDVPEKILENAASLAAFMSEAKFSDFAEVDYTERRNVKRAGRTGMVNYTDYKSLRVKPKKLI